MEHDTIHHDALHAFNGFKFTADELDDTLARIIEDSEWVRLLERYENRKIQNSDELHEFIRLFPESTREPKIQGFLKKETILVSLAQKDNCKKAYEKYIRETHLFTFDPSELIKAEVDLWEKACKTNSITSYKKFIKTYPKSEFVAQAEKNIKPKVEVNLWEIACKTDTIASYKSFISTYPKSKFVAQAEKNIERIDDETIQKALADFKKLAKIVSPLERSRCIDKFCEKWPQEEHRVKKLRRELSDYYDWVDWYNYRYGDIFLSVEEQEEQNWNRDYELEKNHMSWSKFYKRHPHSLFLDDMAEYEVNIIRSDLPILVQMGWVIFIPLCLTMCMLMLLLSFYTINSLLIFLGFQLGNIVVMIAFCVMFFIVLWRFIIFTLDEKIYLYYSHYLFNRKYADVYKAVLNYLDKKSKI